MGASGGTSQLGINIPSIPEKIKYAQPALNCTARPNHHLLSAGPTQ